MFRGFQLNEASQTKNMRCGKGVGALDFEQVSFYAIC